VEAKDAEADNSDGLLEGGGENKGAGHI